MHEASSLIPNTVLTRHDDACLEFQQLEDEGKETIKLSVKTNNLPENSSICYNMDKKQTA